jgi:glycosyltransferase involved in cell wall biosynthesis
MSSPSKVTIGIPTRNRRTYLMESLSSALAQTYKDLEVVVSDDDSSDDTWEYLSSLKDLRLRAMRQRPRLGMTGNFNAVLNAAAGDLFLLLNDDDLLDPTAIEKLSLPFRMPTQGQDPSTIGMSWCASINIDTEGRDLWQTRSGPAMESPVDLLEGVFSGTRGTHISGSLERTSDARSVGGYDNERFGVLCDFAHLGQVALRYEHVVCVPEPLLRYRLHSSSETGTAACRQWQNWMSAQYECFLAILRERGDQEGVGRLLRLRKNLLAQITVEVLMRYIGKPGWKRLFAREIWAGRAFMFTPFVAKRLAKDGWKLLRLK